MIIIIDKLKEYKNIIIYIIMGIFTTIVNLLVYSILVKYLRMNINIANIIAWISAVLFAYITNKIYVFNSRELKFNLVIKELSLFVGGRLITGVFEIAGLPILMALGLNQVIFGVEGLFAKLIIGIVVVIVNYFFSKYFVFRNKENNS
ncbi:GtrA family protein [Miniphocaeibacter massiliensis]|uniref:GtrA family protein n=1 Tax=Miniphocaeibacter massiliensis TaxID=2041841 RepID=UPI001A932A9D|nr:GtrA family protein [Miniphocaeibacter massiliensis]